MSIFSRLNPQKIIDSVTSGIDKSFYTPEEKADMTKKMTELNLDFVKSTMSENSVRSYTRRIIAVSIVSVFLLLMIFGVVMYFFNPLAGQFIITSTSELLGYPFLAIVVFYFGGSVVSGLVKKKQA